MGILINQNKVLFVKHEPALSVGTTGQEHEAMLRLVERGLKPHFVNRAKVWHYVPKERSSLLWLLQRKFKDGISEGLRDSTWTAARLELELKSSYKLLMRHLLCFNYKAVIAYLIKLKRLKGIRNGIKARK